MINETPLEHYLSSGIYAIRNSVDTRVYVGSACVLLRRFKQHKSELRCGKHRNKRLQNFVDKHGIHTLVFEVLELATKDLLICREQAWMDKLGCYQNGFNSTPTAGSSLGTKHSAETKAKISAKSKAQVFTPSMRANIAAARLGKRPPEGAVASLVSLNLSRRGIPLSEDHKNKLRNSGSVTAMLGKRLSIEIRQANIGKQVSQETRNKLSARNFARWSAHKNLTAHQILHSGLLESPP